MGSLQMSTTMSASAVAVSTDWEEKLLREATSHMKRGIRRMPKGYQDFFRDLTRKEPRTKSFFRHVPHVADAMAESGAPLTAVVAPLHAEEARITAKHYADKLGNVEEAAYAETKANERLNCLQIKAAGEVGRLGYVTTETAIEIQEAASEQRTCSDVYAAVVLRDAKKAGR